MKINTDINILGGLPDWKILKSIWNQPIEEVMMGGSLHTFTSLKTEKSAIRFSKAISATLIKFKNPDIEALCSSFLAENDLSSDSLMLFFWNASANNDLLHYLNQEVYFHALYNGRVRIRQNEVAACLIDLREREPSLQAWSDSTLKATASKYLTLLKKFCLLEGGLVKKITHPYISDKMFIVFVYWLLATESKSNLLESEWLKYVLLEKQIFVERVMQKKYAQYFQLTYTGDRLTIEAVLNYNQIYYAIQS
jgi:hypothetical protein